MMSSYYNIVQETIRTRIRADGGDSKKKGTHAYHLEKARATIFSKLVLLLNTLKTNSAFSKFQLTVGGRFPRDEYEELIGCMQRLLMWCSLGSFASTTFEVREAGKEGPTEWSSDFRKLLASVNITSHRVTMLLSMLSSSLSSGQPLPPYMDMPEPFQFAKQLESIDRDILSIRHIAEPEYSAFAVLQIATQCINTDIAKLTSHVKNLVGEVDFSFHAIKASSVSSNATLVGSVDEKDKEA